MSHRLHTAYAGGAVPFTVARPLLRDLLTPSELEQLGVAVRPIFHDTVDYTRAARPMSLSDRQPTTDQLRFYTKERCKRGFLAIAEALRAKHGDRVLVVAVDGPLDAATTDLLEVLGAHVDVAVSLRHAPGTRRTTEEPALARLARATRLGADDWVTLREGLDRLVNYGDSWTAAYVADLLVRRHRAIPPELACTLGVVYNLQNRTIEAERFFRAWGELGGIATARANYSLAMLYARHHPVALQDHVVARGLLERAYEILTGLDQSAFHVRYETIFNRNGYALMLFRERRHAEAAALLEASVERLGQSNKARQVHHSVLVNNLGRVYSALGEPHKARAALADAVAIDPVFPEYRLDLAKHLLEQGETDEARAELERAYTLDPELPDTVALLGYCEAMRGELAAAAAWYDRAARLSPADAGLKLDLAQVLVDGDRHRDALAVLGAIDEAGLADADLERLLLCRIEAQSCAEPARWGRDRVVAELEEALRRLPDAASIRENIADLRAQEAG